MVAYCNAIWRCRYFWLSLVKLDLRSRYRGSVLGMGWSLLQPIAMTLIFTVVFSRMMGGDPRVYAANVLAGLALWNFLVQTTIQGCTTFFQADAYIRQHPAPLAIYPLRTTLGMFFHFLLAVMLAVGISAWGVGPPNPYALLCLPAACALLLAFAWAMATLAGLVTVFFRDTKHLTEIGFQVLFYLTPIFYTETMLGHGLLSQIIRLNPIRPFLYLVRDPIVTGQVPSLWLFTKATLIALSAVSLAVAALARLERRLIFHL
jgi:ABC-type polysaccharide/polyol phosphate export permease